MFKQSLATLLLGCLIAILATSCRPGLEDEQAYPLPPATQALATLMAQGIATSTRTDYPAPIPGPLAAPSTVEANPHLAEPPTPVWAARFYLAGRLGLEVRQVQLIDWNPATWITPNLGCQLSSAFDAQNPIPGYRVVFSAGGQRYEIHGDQSAEQLCLAEPLVGGERLPLQFESDQTRMVELAQAHLSSRLGIPQAEISLARSESARWAENQLGCPALPGEQPLPTSAGEIKGYRLILSEGNTHYEYHSGGSWLVYCGIFD